ncbi:MAG TPA: DUF2089 family protein [Bacteroidales bacterium]|nr:DUF2089 family protein [Bacteroidales bacterium]
MQKTTTLPMHCPSCQQELQVTHLHCENCHTDIQGHFTLPAILRLSPAEQQLLLNYTLCNGSYKRLAKIMPASYPTLRKRVNNLIAKLREVAEE